MVDGFSISNIRGTNESTSAQMANQAEQLAGKGLEFKIKDVGQLTNQKGISRKKDDEQSGTEFEDGLPQNDNSETDNEKERMSEREFAQKDPKEFSVRINPRSEMIELYNNKDSRVVETISAGDLMELISKLDSASGILVNRKI